MISPDTITDLHMKIMVIVDYYIMLSPTIVHPYSMSLLLLVMHMVAITNQKSHSATHQVLLIMVIQYHHVHYINRVWVKEQQTLMKMMQTFEIVELIHQLDQVTIEVLDQLHNELEQQENNQDTEIEFPNYQCQILA